MRCSTKSIRKIQAGAVFVALALFGAGCASSEGYRSAQSSGSTVPVVYVGAPSGQASAASSLHAGSTRSGAFASGSAQAGMTRPGATGSAAMGGSSAQSEIGTQSQQGSTLQGSEQAEWTIPLYSERLNVGKREVGAGEVRLRKVIKSETVNQPVELRREVLIVERVPAEGSEAARSADAAFQEKELVIDLMQEEPVVEKQTMVTGRIVARKNIQNRQETVSREIRSEDITLDENVNSDQIRLIGEFNGSGDQEAIGAPSSQGQVGTARGGADSTPTLQKNQDNQRLQETPDIQNQNQSLDQDTQDIQGTEATRSGTE